MDSTSHATHLLLAPWQQSQRHRICIACQGSGEYEHWHHTCQAPVLPVDWSLKVYYLLQHARQAYHKLRKHGALDCSPVMVGLVTCWAASTNVPVCRLDVAAAMPSSVQCQSMPAIARN